MHEVVRFGVLTEALFVTLKMEAVRSFERSLFTSRNGVTLGQHTRIFIHEAVLAMKPENGHISPSRGFKTAPFLLKFP